MPAGLTLTNVSEALHDLHATVTPARLEDFAVIIDRLFAFARTFGLANVDTAAATMFYRDALRNLPADVLADAVAATCMSWKWGHKLPLPADVAAHAADEMARRRILLGRLEIARMKLAGGPRAFRVNDDD